MLRAFAVILFAILLPLQAAAQTQSAAVALPDPLTPEKVRELVSTLSDADARKMLVEVLDQLGKKAPIAEAEQVELSFTAAVREAATGVASSVLDTLAKAPNVVGGLATAVSNFVERHGLQAIGATIAVMLFSILLGGLAEAGLDRFTGKWHDRIDRAKAPESLMEMLRTLVMRLLVDLGGLIVFFIVLRVVNTNFIATELRPFAHEFIFSLIVVPRAAAAFTRLMISPNNPEWRLVKTDDWTAAFMMRQQTALIAFMGLGAFLISFQVDNGVPLGSTRLGAWTTLVAFLWLAYIVWRARAGLSEMMAGWESDITPAEKWIARVYPTALLVLIAAMWLLVEYLAYLKRFDLIEGGRHYITLLIIGYAPAMDTGIRALVRHIVPPMRGEGEIAAAAWEASRRSYIRMARVVVFALVVLAIARIWDISLTNLAAAGVGAQFAGNLIQALVIFAVGYLVLELATSWINRRLANESTTPHAASEDHDAGEGGGEAGSRLATVLPLLKMLVQAAIVVMTALLALGQIGIDITPLLAGAGIVGLAIGFGAQTLVKDIVSGLFFLIDDAFRVGEYILVGGTEGTVEKISIRSLQLRHTEGPVHTIPYGEIPQVTNASRDWVIVKMKFTVPFDTDMRKVKKIFKTIGADIMKEPYAGDILQTFKLQGVGDVNDVGVVIRGKFTAKPGRQWVARKDIYARVQRLFEENGIEFARREVRVNIGGPGAADLSPEARRQIAAGAANDIGAEAAPA